jgi:hypothetical protein
MFAQVFVLRLDLAEWRATAGSGIPNVMCEVSSASIASQHDLVDQHTADSSTRSDSRVPPAVFCFHDTVLSKVYNFIK